MPVDELDHARALASRVAAAAQLQAIILRDLRWTLPEQYIPPGLPIQLRPEFEAELALFPGSIIYKISTNISAPIPDGTEFFHLSVVYQLVYSLAENMPVSQEEAEAFGSATVMFTVFPYIREILQSTAGRAGLPPILLQPLRVPFVPSGDDPEGAEGETGEVLT